LNLETSFQDVYGENGLRSNPVGHVPVIILIVINYGQIRRTLSRRILKWVSFLWIEMKYQREHDQLQQQKW